MNLESLRSQDRASILFLILGVPLFFPRIFVGEIPGPFAVGLGDNYVFFEPYARVFMRAILSGENPFWSHVSSFGAPTLLTLATGALHPFHLFHLLVPDWLAAALANWARMALFAAYFFAYFRRVDVRPWLALPFTLSLTYGSFFINYSQEIIGYVIAFFPMALFHADRLCARTGLADFVLLAVAVACMVLGGFPSIILYLLLTLGAYLLVVATGWRPLLFAGLACCAGLSLVLPAIIETLSFYPTTGYDPEQRKWLFFYNPPATTAFNLVIPSIFGNMQEYAKAGMRDYFGSLLGAGILTVPLAVVSAAYLLTRTLPARIGVFWLSVAVLCVILYFNVFEIKQLLKVVPVLNEHPFTRLQALIVFAATVSAAIFLDQMLRIRVSAYHWLVVLGATSLSLATAYALAFRMMRGEHTIANLATYGAIGTISMSALAWAVLKPSKLVRGAFVGSSLALGIATSLTYSYYFVPKDYYPERELIRHIKRSLVPGARVLDVQDVLFRSTAIAHGVHALDVINRIPKLYAV